jgi:hypothetical protein
MPKPTKSIAKIFSQRIQNLEATRSRMERALLAGSIPLDDVAQVYAGLFLEVFTEFEALLEDLFLGLLSGELYSLTNPIKRIVIIKPVSKVQDVIFGGRPYLDWLPYAQYTLLRAQMYFEDGKPFSYLTQPQKDTLHNYILIRNAIAHKSDIARKKFEYMIRQLPLLAHERMPGGYLRSKPHAGVGQNQYEIAVIELEIIAKNLCI